MSQHIINETIHTGADIKKSHDSQVSTDGTPSLSSTSNDVQAKSISQKLSLIFASIALGSDGYQANIIGAVERCLEKIYGASVLSNGLSTRVSNAMLIGDIVGQVGFGFIIDRMGRKFGIIACTMFVCLVKKKGKKKAYLIFI